MELIAKGVPMKNTFDRIVLPIFGVFGTLITILTFVLPAYANIGVPLSVYVITILFLLVGIAIPTKLALDLRNAATTKEYNDFRITPVQYVREQQVFLLAKQILLPLNTAATIYAREGYFEKPVAIGFVSHIQEEFIHVKVFGLLEKSLEIDQMQLKNITIGPTANVNQIIKLVTEEGSR